MFVFIDLLLFYQYIDVLLENKFYLLESLILDFYLIILNFTKFFNFLFFGFISFLKKLFNQYLELHRSLSLFDKIFWYGFLAYLLFLVLLYLNFHYELLLVNHKVNGINNIANAFVYTYKHREKLMIAIKYRMQDITRSRLFYSRHLKECLHPFDDARHAMVRRDFFPAPWAKYGSKR